MAVTRALFARAISALLLVAFCLQGLPLAWADPTAGVPNVAAIVESPSQRTTYDATTDVSVGPSHGAGAHSSSASGQRRIDSPPAAASAGSDAVVALRVATNTGGKTLVHYTDEAGMKGILDSGKLNPSLKTVNPADARYGNGQYLSDLAPGTKTCAQLSRCFLGQPFQGQRFTNYVEINVDGLNVVQGRANVFVVPGETPLDLTGRIVGFGAN